MTKNTHGGVRDGAGRAATYGEAEIRKTYGLTKSAIDGLTRDFGSVQAALNGVCEIYANRDGAVRVMYFTPLDEASTVATEEVSDGFA